MKKIKAVKIWYNGSFIEAIQFQLNAINVNLESSATFYYALFSEDNIKLTEGNLYMEGQDYQNWQNDEFAWTWAENKLKLEIIPEIIEEKSVIL
jgi:hypothetical protein